MDYFPFFFSRIRRPHSADYIGLGSNNLSSPLISLECFWSLQVDDKGSSESVENFYDVVDLNYSGDISSDDAECLHKNVNSQQTLVTTL